jgi:hypothetical protein
MYKVKITREASWFGLLEDLDLYAEGEEFLELGHLAGGTTIEVTLPENAKYIWGEIYGIPTPKLSLSSLKSGGAIVIQSNATLSNSFSRSELPLALRAVQPNDVVNVGSRKEKILKGASVVIAIIFTMIAVIAVIKESWRLTDFDSRAQYEKATGSGFSDKATYLLAQELGIESQEEWGVLQAEMTANGFSDMRDYRAYIDGGFESKSEYLTAKAAGAYTRQKWLADAEWQELPAFPESMLLMQNLQGGKGCDDIIEAKYWQSYPGSPKAGYYRNATLQIIQPFHKRRYYLIYVEFFDTRNLLSEPLLRMWRSKKDERYYLAYYGTNAFELYFQDSTGLFKEAMAQVDGAPYTDEKRLSESVDVMNRVKARRSPDEYRKWGIIPGSFEETKLLSCERRNYETIENIRFVDTQTGQSATIKELLTN